MSNVGEMFENMRKESVRLLFKRICRDLGYEGWTLRWCSDEYCWIKRKRIDLDPRSTTLEMALIHEIAHIDTLPERYGKGLNHHTARFFSRVEELAQRYLGRGLDEYQQWLRDGYVNGGFGDPVR